MAGEALSELALGRFPLGETVIVPTEELRPSDENPRYITEERFAALRIAVRTDPEHFRARPCIARLDGEVVAGNMRLRANLAEGIAETPVFFTDRPLEEIRLLAIRDNVPYGAWDDTALAEWVYSLSQTDGLDLSLTGLEPAALDELLASVSSFVPDDVLPPNLDETNPPAEVVCPECGHTFTA
jgi:hypothetical protein